MKKNAWLLVFLLLFLMYYLSSIPGLRVLPILKEINTLLRSIELSFTKLAAAIAARLPGELSPARTLTEDFIAYARENPVVIEFMLRKSAHIILFFFITIAFFLLLRYYFKTPYRAAAVSFFAASAAAILDEYHQTFVPDRSGSLIDVGINLIGITAAIFLILFALFIAGKYSS